MGPVFHWGMITLPVTCTDDEIRQVVVDWSELLAAGKFDEALEMCPPKSDSHWTSDLLQRNIAGYGFPDEEPEGLARLHARHGVEKLEITPLLGREDADDIIAGIDVDRENLYGMEAGEYTGMVHYDGVPLSHMRSDLTAIFAIRRVDPDRIALEFEELHVM